jgi:hypothetical protein
MAIKAIANFQSSEQASNQQSSSQNKAISDLSKNSLMGGSVLHSIVLKSGSNDVSHKLGSKLQGWFLTRIRGNATVYDKQDGNKAPDKTLTLVASADVTVDIYVF